MQNFRRGPRLAGRAWLLAAAGAPLLWGVSLPAAGQTAPVPPPQAAAGGTGVEQVVVTAQHRREYAKDVPIAVSTLNARTVADLLVDGEDIRAISAEVPSLYAESSFGRTYPRFYIRGLGNSDFTYNAQQPVSVVYDDVVEENAVLKAFPIFDIQDVEILKGPQGTLFGRNTPAGVIKVDSIKPNDEYHGYVNVSEGTYNTANITAGLGGAIVPQKLDFRVAVQNEYRDNWITNINPLPTNQKHLEGYDDFAGKAALLFKPTDDLDMLLEVQDRQLEGTARVFRADIIQPGTDHLVPGFKIDQVDLNGEDIQQEGQFATHFTVDDNLGPVKLTSISAWEHAQTFSRGDVDGGNYQVPPPLGQEGLGGFDDQTSDAIPSLNQLTEEIRLSTTGSGPFFNQGGIYVFKENLRIDSLDYTVENIPDIALYQRQDTTSFGAFDSATYKITPDLTAGAGVRLSTEHKTYSVFCSYTCAPPLQPVVHTNYTEPTWDVDLDYAVTPQANVYGRVSTGYLAPALDGRNVEYDFGNLVAGAYTEAKAETTISYEVGLKSTILQDKVNFNADLFDWDTKNLQLTAVGGAFNSTQLKNAKDAIGRGFEAQIDTRPIPNLRLSGSASYNFTEIRDPGLIVSGCGGGCTVTNAPVIGEPGNYYINHNALPNAPRWIIDGHARYTVPIADEQDIYFDTDWSYRSDVNFLLYDSLEFRGMALVEGGVRIGYENHARGFEVAVYARNVLDQIRITGGIDFDNLTGFVNDPRIIGFQAGYKF
jgi:iron complex outermembrane receptor protein